MPQEEKSIIRSLLEPSIELDEISFADVEEGTDPVSENSRGFKEQKKVGNLFPLIVINDYIISEEELERMTIDSTGFLPEISIKMVLSQTSTFISKSMPKDGDLMNVFIRARSDEFKPIRNDYLITAVSTSKSVSPDGHGMSIIISGELFIPNLYDERILAKTGTSYNILKEVAQDLGLGFASNETETNDSQTWLCGNNSYYNFIHHITGSSWKNENSFFQCFIDVYYHLNFVNVNNQFSDNVLIDDALVDMLLSDDTLENEEIKLTIDKKVFTNITDKQGTPMWIKKYAMINQSSEISKKYGYKMHCEFFEQNTLQKWDIFSEPLVIENDAQDKILLKGRPNEDFFKSQIKKRWAGLQYSLPEHNVHEKYLYAQINNLMNNSELQKLQLKIEVPRANFNIYRGERIPCVLISVGDPRKTPYLQDEKQIAEGGEMAYPTAPVLDKFLSGYYMIQGMIFSYRTRNPDLPEDRAFFSEDIILTRRVWPAP